MNAKKKAWRQDDGSLDLMQLFVGMLIISIAAVGTFQALFYGYEQLDFQMRYRKAISMGRSYVEYWQGRVHTDLDFDDRRILNGNLGNPEIFLLDERDPTTSYDDIYCEVAYGPIVPFNDPSTEGTDHYLIQVHVSWFEPGEDRRALPHDIIFHAAMVPASL